MGAFAGSSALLCKERTGGLRVVTLTINNKCNLKCPHCYLQYDSSADELAPEIVEAIGKSGARHVSVVGMEPLVNRGVAKTLSETVAVLADRGKQVSFITNGLNAHLLDADTAKQVAWVDVSIDGSARTYERFRGAPYSKLVRGIETLYAKGVRDIRVLQTVHSENIDELDALVSVGKQVGATLTVLSPFAATRHQGSQGRLGITPDQLLVSGSELAEKLDDVWLVTEASWLDAADFAKQRRVIDAMFGSRAVLFESDPIDYGMVRVTYEGQIMSPREAMHTRDYLTKESRIGAISIDDFFQLRNSFDAELAA